MDSYSPAVNPRSVSLTTETLVKVVAKEDCLLSYFVTCFTSINVISNTSAVFGGIIFDNPAEP